MRLSSHQLRIRSHVTATFTKASLSKMVLDGKPDRDFWVMKMPRRPMFVRRRRTWGLPKPVFSVGKYDFKFETLKTPKLQIVSNSIGF